MTLEEILKSQGLTEEQIKTIIGEMKQNKVFTASEENLDIRYKDLQGKYAGKEQEHKEAAALIEQLKKDNAGNEALQQKITTYEQQVAQLQKDLEQTRLDAALKVELLSAKALDVDYLSFKLKEKGELALDDQGKIKGFEDKLAALKTQFPMQFEAPGKQTIIENKLPADPDQERSVEPKSLAEALKMKYETNKI